MFLAFTLFLIFVLLRFLIALYSAPDLDLKKFCTVSKFTGIKAYSSFNLFRIKKDSETGFVIIFRPKRILSAQSKTKRIF